MLQLQEVVEIYTMGKISSQAETLALTSGERNALPSHGHRGWGRVEEAEYLIYS